MPETPDPAQPQSPQGTSPDAEPGFNPVASTRSPQHTGSRRQARLLNAASPSPNPLPQGAGALSRYFAAQIMPRVMSVSVGSDLTTAALWPTEL